MTNTLSLTENHTLATPAFVVERGEEALYTESFVMPWQGSLTATHNGEVLLHLKLEEQAPVTAMNAQVPAASSLSRQFLSQPFLSRQLHQALAAYLQGNDSLLQALPYCFPKASTSFQRKVWQALLSLSWGQTCSYKQLAERVGYAGAARAVGGALAKNPFPLVLPCHRVLGSQGQLTGFMGSRGITLKQALLERERTEDAKTKNLRG